MTMHVHPIEPAGASVWSRLIAVVRRYRGLLIAALLVASVAALISSLWTLHRLNQQNAAIAALQAGDETAAEPQSSAVALARVNFLIARDRFDDAQVVVDAAKSGAAPHAMSRMLYNQANANVRRAFAAVEASKPDAAIPLIKLAKDAYREALRLEPDFWNAKHNLDVATRLMRDFPGHEQEGEEVPPDAEVKLWTDLPGVPQGAP